MKPKLLDLFCGEGGASAGYAMAGFEVMGVDLNSQDRYPFPFIRADALEVLADRDFMDQFTAVAASPPCQRYTRAQVLRGNDHPDLVGPVRTALDLLDIPYVIENVEGSPLRPDLMLCGTMFGLRTYRHRVFEFGQFSMGGGAPEHPKHTVRRAKMGRRVGPGEFMTIVGNFAGVELAREIMGMPWASRDGLREAIPPAYSEFIGKSMLNAIGYSPRASE